ncbi:ABC transporter substrate-binding protein [Paenibacillus nasutitermitis]|uniref:Multiple sugar transport system substrate-binding protein n=1 Tax=Paenibacillus nasutitermitis TaxID=1652958 RepID=A0A916YI77_9BACL|nr:ABC transporter substrate-binding protein [Paenibacillus nasutitermitis]GGD46790.1 hypothetical protein GCM10010911_00350 [Paenibacillus nasutitermitis]
MIRNFITGMSVTFKVPSPIHWRGIWLSVFAGLTVLLLLSGCTEDSTKQKPVGAIKVAVGDERMFEWYYQDYFDLVYPDVPIEFVITGDIYKDGDPLGAYAKLIEENKPDIIISAPAYYDHIANLGLLEDLTDWMSRSKMVETDYQPGVVKMLKNNQEHKIYGLSPDYDSSLLYYNADLFKQFGIEPPTSGMTWKELLQLSSRFEQAGKSEEDIIGYHDPWMQDLNSFIFNTLNGTEGLQLVDWKRGKHLIDTPAWRQLMETGVNAIREGGVKIQGVELREEDGVKYIDEGAIAKQDLFAKGKAAMAIDMYANRTRFDQAKFNWSAVLPPVNSANRESGGFMRMDGVFSIAASSQIKEEAWKMLRFIGGERVAKVISKTDGKLSIHQSGLKYNTDPLAEIAFSQQPTLTPVDFTDRGDFYKEENAMIETELQAVLKEKQTLDAAIQNMQKKGQAFVDLYGVKK